MRDVEVVVANCHQEVAILLLGVFIWSLVARVEDLLPFTEVLLLAHNGCTWDRVFYHYESRNSCNNT